MPPPSSSEPESAPLKPWSYVVLALVGAGGAGAHDLVDMLRRGGRLLYAAAPSQLYAETKRLAGLGLLDARTEPGQTRPRTVYTLTAAGRTALVDWLARPAPFPRIQSEANVRLLAGDLIDDAAIVRSLEGLRAEARELEAVVEENERRAERLPHRARYLRLSHSLSRRLLQAHLEWLDEVRATLGEPGVPGDTGPAATVDAAARQGASR
jgi:DNA-binding PadR family transcriptional regulator